MNFSWNWNSQNGNLRSYDFYHAERFRNQQFLPRLFEIYRLALGAQINFHKGFTFCLVNCSHVQNYLWQCRRPRRNSDFWLLTNFSYRPSMTLPPPKSRTFGICLWCHNPNHLLLGSFEDLICCQNLTFVSVSKTNKKYILFLWNSFIFFSKF